MGSSSSTRSTVSLRDMTDDEINKVVHRELERGSEKADLDLANEIDQCCRHGRPLDIAFLHSVASLYKNNPARLVYFFEEPKFNCLPPIYATILYRKFDIAEFLLTHSPHRGKILTTDYQYGSLVCNASILILQNREFEFLQRITDKGYVRIQDVFAQWTDTNLSEALLSMSDFHLYQLGALADKHLFERLLAILQQLNFRYLSTFDRLRFLEYENPTYWRYQDYQQHPRKYEGKFLRKKEAKREILLKGFYSPEVTPFTWLHEDDGLVGLTSRIILENTAFHLRQDAESSM